MLVLDPVLRFVGQRVAAVVADTEAAAEAACARIAIEYEVLPPVLDAETAATAPPIHAGSSNIAAEIHAETGDVTAGFAAADTIHEATYHSQRVQHAHLETHGAIGWMEGGVLTLRTSTQVPFLTRDAVATLFDLPRDGVRVVCERVGGGFGGKQEMLVEDIVALAVLRTGRPVKLELTRQEQFMATTTRHAMRVRVRIGARADGTLTAMAVNVLSDTGAYAQSCRRRAAPRVRREPSGVSLRQQAGGRPSGPYHHGAGRRVPRLWAEPDGVCGGKRHGRVGASTKHRSVHPAPPECIPAR